LAFGRMGLSCLCSFTAPCTCGTLGFMLIYFRLLFLLFILLPLLMLLRTVCCCLLVGFPFLHIFICKLYKVLLRFCFFVYQNFISFIIRILCIFSIYLVMNLLCEIIFMCAYLGVKFCSKLVLLKRTFALEFNNLSFMLMYLFVLCAWLRWTIFMVCILLCVMISQIGESTQQ
jgi:hypothetical protein